MKKSNLLLLCGLLFAILLNGCSASSPQNTTTPSASEAKSSEAQESKGKGESSQAAETTAAADPSEIVTKAEKEADALVYKNDSGKTVVKHAYGETVMPEKPQRIVSIKVEDLMLALDVPMVACRDFDDFYLHQQLAALNIGKITVDEEANTINYEEVMSYKPDLIVIRDSFDKSIYDELSKIAPTFALHLQDSRSSLLVLGRALGRGEDASKRLQQFQDTVMDARQRLSSVDGTVSMLRVMKKEIRLYPYSKNDMSAFLYADLGLKPAPMVVAYDTADNLAISLETLPDLKTDYIFLVAGYGSLGSEDDAAAKKRYEEMTADPLWKTIPAVQNGHVYDVEARLWVAHGLLAEEMKIADVLKALQK